MNSSCDVIKDLLPLYHDGVCSEKSKIIVEEHLKDCTDCKNYLETIDTDVFNYANISKEEEVKINSLKKIRRKNLRKSTIIVIISFLLTVPIVWGAYSYAYFYETAVQYSDDMLSKDFDDINDILLNKDFCRSYVVLKTVEKYGEERLVAYIYYTKTLLNNKSAQSTDYTDYTTMQMYNEYKALNDYSDFYARTYFIDNISAVYYYIGDYQQLRNIPDEKFKMPKDAVLIWEK